MTGSASPYRPDGPRRQGTHRPAGVGGRSAVWIGSAELEWEPDPRSDHETVLAGWVSVTPLHTDWTHHAVLGAVEALTVPTTAEVE